MSMHSDLGKALRYTEPCLPIKPFTKKPLPLLSRQGKGSLEIVPELPKNQCTDCPRIQKLLVHLNSIGEIIIYLLHITSWWYLQLIRG